MSKSRTLQELTPEQHKAVQRFLQAQAEWEDNIQTLPAFVLPTDFFALSITSFPKMVHDATWIWNQTNSKIRIPLENGELLLQKLNARKRRGCPKAPSYKVWQYTLEQQEEPQKLHGLWCEKGADATQPQTPAERHLLTTNFPYATEHAIKIPTIQQVKEFNRQDSQLKKRDRTEPSDVEAPPTKYLKSTANMNTPPISSPLGGQLPLTPYVPQITCAASNSPPLEQLHSNSPPTNRKILPIQNPVSQFGGGGVHMFHQQKPVLPHQQFSQWRPPQMESQTHQVISQDQSTGNEFTMLPNTQHTAPTTFSFSPQS